MRIIAGHLKNRKILSLKGELTRPTSSRMRETLFNICQNEIVDCEFLDLFAGTGAMGLEALSRGAKSATFVDSCKDAIRNIHRNIEQMDLKKSSVVINGDVFKTLDRLVTRGKKYEIIYADPPYGKEFSSLLLKFVDEGALLPSSGMLFIEEKRDHPIESDKLNTLSLKSVRKSGSSMLLQFVRI